MRKLTLTVALLVALGGAAGQTAQANNAVVVNSRIQNYISQTWHMQIVMGGRTTPTNYSFMRTHSNAYRTWVLKYWQKTYRSTYGRFQYPPYASALSCIHNYEGSWTDGGAPYYGGLQMDFGFMATYGGYLLKTKGTADHWTPLEQEWVAARAVNSGRGFYPWPNTARMCGLI